MHGTDFIDEEKLDLSTIFKVEPEMQIEIILFLTLE